MKKIEPILTVFTPTYNRAYSLPALYNSLIRQTDKRFVWMVVDDGSTDNTRNLIEKWQGERLLNIEYVYQSNQGKMIAHNHAASLCTTELFVCLDSDDWMTDTAVEDILSFWIEHNADRSDLIGVISPKIIVDDTHAVLRKPSIPKGLQYASGQGLYQAGYQGETAMVFRSSILKEYPFPVQDGEKFISEIAAYDKMDERYVYAMLDKPVMVCMYRPDGYSNNQLRIYVNNPKGVIFVLQQRNNHINRFSPTLTRKYIAYSRIANYSWKKILKEAYNPFLCFLMIPFGLYEKRQIIASVKRTKI